MPAKPLAETGKVVYNSFMGGFTGHVAGRLEAAIGRVTGNATARLIREEIQTQASWEEKMRPIESINRGVESEESPLRAAIESHYAVYDKIRDQHPVAWAFWAGNGQDAEEQITALAETLSAMAENPGPVEPGRQDLRALRRIGIASDFKETDIDNDQQNFMLKEGDLKLLFEQGGGMDSGYFRLLLQRGDPGQAAAQLRSYLDKQEGEQKEALKAELERLYAELHSTFTECEQEVALLSGSEQ